MDFLSYERPSSAAHPYRRYFIGQAIQAAQAITGAVVQGIGAAKNRKKYDALADNITQKKTDLQSMYKQQMATPYTSTAEGANAQRMMRQQAEQASRAASNSAIRTGTSAEAQVAQAAAAQEANANAIGNMAAQGTARQDALRNEMQGQVNALDDQYNNMKLKQIDASNAAYAALANAS